VLASPVSQYYLSINYKFELNVGAVLYVMIEFDVMIFGPSLAINVTDPDGLLINSFGGCIELIYESV
jgi:hypothetical protein